MKYKTQNTNKITNKIYYCKDCEERISYQSALYGEGRCNHCAHMIDGRSLKNYYCIECGVEITRSSGVYGTGKCKSCAAVKHGRSLKKYLCIDCDVEICYKTKRCQSCEMKRRWKNKTFREKMIKASMKGRLIKPNKIEKIMNKLLKRIFHNEYKFVGDGQLILGGFCPDFVNKTNNEIIEVYGDYWHKRPEVVKRDKRRMKTYKKYGYNVLIVWEKELKNLDKVKNRILEFNKQGD